MKPNAPDDGRDLPWDAPELFPVGESTRVAKYRRLQSRYRHEVLHVKPGQAGNYPALGSYLDADEVAAQPLLNFLSQAALDHALEREASVKSERGALDPVRLHRNMLSSMPLCFNLFGTMRAEPAFLEVFQRLFDAEATQILEIICEWAPQPPSEHLDDRTAFDAVVFYDTANGLRFCGIETKYTEPFSDKVYASARYEEITATSGWFVGGPDAVETLKHRKSNQLWRNLMLAASLEAEGSRGAGRVAVVALADDSVAQAAISIVQPELVGSDRLVSVSLESIVAESRQHDSLAPWATEFARRYLG